METSEAGSVLASPVQLTPEEAEGERQREEREEEEGRLASQLAAAVKKRKTKEKDDGGVEKDSRSSFIKRWSLKRKSREKNKGSLPTNKTQQQQEETPSQTMEAVSEAVSVVAGEVEEVELGGETEIVSPDDERLLPPSNEEGGDIQSELERRARERESERQRERLTRKHSFHR